MKASEREEQLERRREEGKQRSKDEQRWFLMGALIVTSVWFVCLVIGLVALACGKVTLGEFGDFFGAVNSLFSGVALLGAVYALIQQQAQLRNAEIQVELTRVEMRQTREVHEESAESQERMAEIQARTVLLQAAQNDGEVLPKLSEEGEVLLRDLRAGLVTMRSNLKVFEKSGASHDYGMQLEDEYTLLETVNTFLTYHYDPEIFEVKKGRLVERYRRIISLGEKMESRLIYELSSLRQETQVNQEQRGENLVALHELLRDIRKDPEAG